MKQEESQIKLLNSILKEIDKKKKEIPTKGDTIKPEVAYNVGEWTGLVESATIIVKHRARILKKDARWKKH